MSRTGKHPDKSLTAVKVRAIKHPGRYADGGGLYLEVDPSGAKRWFLRTMVQGRRCHIGLGGTSVVSLAEAREAALATRKVAKAGGDPLADRRKAKRVVPTFEDAARKVHEEHAPAWKNAKHGQQWINTLRDYVFPIIGNRRVDQIDSADVLKVLSTIWLAKPETARRVKQRVKTVLDWCRANHFRSGENPIEGIAKALPKQPKKDSHHTALPYSEIAAFITRLRNGNAGEIVKLAFEFTILTAGRTGEVLGARWDEIEGDVWTVPAERMKAGREHRVPLSPRCIEILNKVRSLSGNQHYIFPGKSRGKPLSNMSFLMILRRMDLKITGHGFRSAFRDWAAERTNFPRDVCEMALAHT
ncbi:MAG: tyrosine-type recombinase/integrase, partial [Geminicoccaceae bacterium]